MSFRHFYRLVLNNIDESVRVFTFFRIFFTKMVFYPRKIPDFSATNRHPSNLALFLGQAPILDYYQVGMNEKQLQKLLGIHEMPEKHEGKLRIIY